MDLVFEANLFNYLSECCWCSIECKKSKIMPKKKSIFFRRDQSIYFEFSIFAPPYVGIKNGKSLKGPYVVSE